MKKIVCLAIGLTTVVSFAQNNKSTEFTKKLNYKIEVLVKDNESYNQGEYDKISYDHYLGKNTKESLLSFYYNEASENTYASESNYYVKNNWMIPVTVSGISKTLSYVPYSAFKVVDDNKTIAKLDRKGTVNGLSCQYYAVLSDKEDKESYDYCFCIDESNKINNAESLFPDTKIKGLVLAVEPNSQEYRLVYKSSENSSLKLDLDAEKMLAEVEEYQAQIATDTMAVAEIAPPAYEDSSATVYTDPLYSYSYDDETINDYNLFNYLSPIYTITSNALYNVKEYNNEGTIERKQVARFFEKESKSLVKNLATSKLITSDQKKKLKKYFEEQNKKVKEFKVGQIMATDVAMDAAVAVAEPADYAEADYSYYTKYESVYKDGEIEEVSLAYSILDDDQFKDNAPDYCNDLKNKIPAFQNKDLKKHVENVTGQICDLYLYNNGGNVDYLGTINSMRKSLLEIEKLRATLSQKDQKSLLEFLKSLD